MKLLFCLFFASAPVLAQTVRFEVASIRACKGDTALGRKRGGREFSPDRVYLPCQTTLSLIHWAYGNFAGPHFDPMASTPITGGSRQIVIR